ncbi:IS3 family transposase [Anaerococcus nagyae]|uniref:IS3 family transposase n=1 Tax=Anaerococcus nagyae TaxID=1755241 RepID=UPI003736FA38
MAKYSTEFKMKVVKEYLESNISYKNLSDKYNITTSSIIKNWVNAYKSQGFEELKVERKNTQYTMENFFGILKQEIYYGNKFYSYEHLKKTIEDFIKYYNEERIKEKLGYLSPVEYRKKNAA